MSERKNVKSRRRFLEELAIGTGALGLLGQRTVANAALLPPPPLAHQRMMFWLNVPRWERYDIIDAPLRRRLFSRAPTHVVLNGPLDGGYAELVAAIKQEFPSVKVLRYSNAQRIPERGIASTMFAEVEQDWESLALIKTNGEPKILGSSPNREIWTDLTKPATRSYIATHIGDRVAEDGTDGVAIDSFHTELDPYTPYLDGEQKNAEWPASCVKLLKKVRAKLPAGKEIWINGLWAHRGDGQVDRQAALLPYVDGMSVEFYGYDGRPIDNPGTITTGTFDVFVSPLNDVISANPKKPFMVRGTSPGQVYHDYGVDLQYARYCYGCYLLGARTPSSFFSYGQNFLVGRLPLERAGGTAVHSYLDLPLDDPVAPAVHDGTGGYSREYQGGIVFVAPADRGPRTWTVPFAAWSTTGQPYLAGSLLSLAEGDARILLRFQPSPPPATGDAVMADSTSEWLVQDVTGEYRYESLQLNVRSTDLASAVLVRFETDDNPPPDVDPSPFGILEVLPEGGTFDAGTKDYGYRQTPRLRAVHVKSRSEYPADGVCHTLTIDLATDCAPYPGYRVISVRAIRAEVELIRLSSPVPIQYSL